MDETFQVTFYRQWASALLTLGLSTPVALAALQLSSFSNAGFLVYAAVLLGGFWGVVKLVKRWTLLPTSVTVGPTAVTFHDLTTDEQLTIPFAEVQDCQLTPSRLVLRLADGSRLKREVNSKYYNPGDFYALCRCLGRAWRRSR